MHVCVSIDRGKRSDRWKSKKMKKKAASRQEKKITD